MGNFILFIIYFRNSQEQSDDYKDLEYNTNSYNKFINKIKTSQVCIFNKNFHKYSHSSKIINLTDLGKF